MKKKLSVIAITIICIILLCSCAMEKDRNKEALVDWDLLVTGCSDQWDIDLQDNENYKIGIIDFHTIVFSDSRKTKQFHDELILKLVEKIAPHCEVQTVILSQEATSVEINDAIQSLHKSGCHIINMSFGQSESIPFSSYVLDKIENETLVLVCAAGNQSKGLLYPAAENNTVSVYAKDINGGIAKVNLDAEVKKSFSAPGYHIYIDGDYYSGSSLATVYTSIAFAVLYAQEQVSTIDLIEIAQNKTINAVGINDYGIITICPN